MAGVDLPPSGLYSDYDMKFTADISRQMQMPDRLGAVGGMRQLDGFSNAVSRGLVSDSAMFGMTMPDRLLLGESDYSIEHSAPAVNGYSDLAYEEFEDREELQIQFPETPVKHNRDTELFSAGDYVVPPTPGSMLRGSQAALGGPDAFADFTSLQRHIAKLTCRIDRLEEENSRRSQREWILYPLFIGYCVVHLVRMLVAQSK